MLQNNTDQSGPSLTWSRIVIGVVDCSYKYGCKLCEGPPYEMGTISMLPHFLFVILQFGITLGLKDKQ